MWHGSRQWGNELPNRITDTRGEGSPFRATGAEGWLGRRAWTLAGRGAGARRRLRSAGDRGDGVAVRRVVAGEKLFELLA